MTKREILFVNKTSKTWNFAVYQSYPESTGLQSVAWKVGILSAVKTLPTQDLVQWDMTYGLLSYRE